MVVVRDGRNIYRKGAILHQQLDESATDPLLNDGLDLFIGSIREVRDCPASVDENLFVERLNEVCENGKSRRDLARVSLIAPQVSNSENIPLPNPAGDSFLDKSWKASKSHF